MEQLKIKVNGLCQVGDISRAAQMGADSVGLQFAKGKPHRMSMLHRDAGILPDEADADYSSLSSEGEESATSLVGMFSDEGAQLIVTAVYNYCLDAIQIDSDCGAVLLRNLLSTIVPDIRPRLDIIKTIAVSSPADFALCKAYDSVANLFIFRFNNAAFRSRSWADKVLAAAARVGNVPFLVQCRVRDAQTVEAAFRGNGMFRGLDVYPDKGAFEVEEYMQKVKEMARKVKE